MDKNTDQFWEIYELLPKPLQDAIFSERTAKSIGSACTYAGIEDSRVRDIAKYTGRVLLGLVSPQELSGTLTREVEDIDEDTADKIVSRIDRLVFMPVRGELSQLYPETENTSQENDQKQKPQRGDDKDAYRETI